MLQRILPAGFVAPRLPTITQAKIPICVWHSRTGHFADRLASSSRKQTEVRRTCV